MWYDSGTVSVTNGSTTVTGSGTDWISGVGIGEGFYGPDGRLYEIASIGSATSLTLGSAYLGATNTGQAYTIVPTQSYIRDLAAQAAQLVADYAAVASNAGAGKFGDGTLANPGVRFTADENTGMRRVSSDVLALVVGGADKVTVTNTGINSTAIGSTTPSTGAFTTLSASGAITAQNGVTFGASGVANGTAVFKRSSDGLTVGTIAVDSVNSQFDISTAYSYLQLATDTGEKLLIGPTGLSVTGALSATGDIIAGGSSPFYAAAGRGNVTSRGTSSAIFALGVNGVEAGYLYGTGSAVTLGAPTGVPIIFDINGERVRIDTAGNLGLGVTPSAWGTSGTVLKAIQLGSGANGGNFVAGGNGFSGSFIGANAYYNGTNWVYSSTNGASYYNTSGNGHAWYTAPSGTAGNAISFGDPKMTLDASGNLGVGATSPLAKIHAMSSAASVTFALSPNNSNTNIAYLTNDATYISLGSSVGSTGVKFRVALGAPDNAATIDSSGNLLVGTTASTSARVTVVAATTTSGAINASQPNSATGTCYTSSSVTTAGGGWYHFVGQSGNGSIVTDNNIYILGNGNIQNTNNSYGAISDVKLKENITDATPKLAGLMQVRVVNYNLKTDPEHKQLGVIAQELEQVFPGMVEETPDYIEVTKSREVEVPAAEAVLDDEGNVVTPAVEATTRTEEYTEREATGEVTKSVKYSVFVPMLIKAMQEQQAQIEALTARLAALEAA